VWLKQGFIYENVVFIAKTFSLIFVYSINKNGMETINLKGLAARLGISISSVSKALRDSHEISIETKERVRTLARELNYQPNPYASSLRKQKSKTIAVVIPEVANHFFSLAINGIESIAQERDYHVLIYLTHEDIEKEIAICKHLQSGRVDGVLMSASMGASGPEHIQELLKQNIPLVFFDRNWPEIETAKIMTNDRECSFLATEHLIQNGCENIYFLALTSTLNINTERWEGFREALKKYNMPLHRSQLISCDLDDVLNHKRIRRALTKKNRPDAIFSSIEKMAITTYEVCRELSIRIPQDLKVVCFSNMSSAHLMCPPLSTVRQPAFEMGKNAAAVLFRSLEKKGGFIPNEEIIVPSKLLARESSSI
jgi:LacI family transcriptional regulator